MSTYYAPAWPSTVIFADVFDGRLERFGVREFVGEDTSDSCRCLTDGHNYLWAHADSDGKLENIRRSGPTAPGRILGAIAESFETEIFSEYEPQYWGFATEEEWDQAWAEIDKKHEAEFHADIINFVKGEPNEIRPGTIGMIKAEIAKDITTKDPSLLSPEKKPELMAAIERVYDADHAVVVKLSERDIAAADMVATNEDDLPQGLEDGGTFKTAFRRNPESSKEVAKLCLERQEQAIEAGVTPLEIMIADMRFHHAAAIRELDRGSDADFAR